MECVLTTYIFLCEKDNKEKKVSIKAKSYDDARWELVNSGYKIKHLLYTK